MFLGLPLLAILGCPRKAPKHNSKNFQPISNNEVENQVNKLCAKIQHDFNTQDMLAFGPGFTWSTMWRRTPPNL